MEAKSSMQVIILLHEKTRYEKQSVLCIKKWMHPKGRLAARY